MGKEDAIFYAACKYISAQPVQGLDERKRQIVLSNAFELAEATVAEHEKRIAARAEAAKAEAEKPAEAPPAS